MPDAYDDMKRSALSALADSRGLDAAGTKAELIDRLREQDASVPAAPPATAAKADAVADEAADAVAAGDAEPSVPAPSPKESGAWDDLGASLYQTLREEAKDVWNAGAEDREWLRSIAQRIAKEKYLAARGESNSVRQAHATNLLHLEAQLRGEIVRKRMAFTAAGSVVFEKILVTVLKTVASALLGALL
jgi:hypothetical protein